METQQPFKPSAKYLTVQQVSERRHLHPCTIRRLFINEPGVIVIIFQKPGKRSYRTLRIPETAERRVFARFTNGGIAA